MSPRSRRGRIAKLQNFSAIDQLQPTDTSASLFLKQSIERNFAVAANDARKIAVCLNGHPHREALKQAYRDAHSLHTCLQSGRRYYRQHRRDDIKVFGAHLLTAEELVEAFLILAASVVRTSKYGLQAELWSCCRIFAEHIADCVEDRARQAHAAAYGSMLPGKTN